MTNPKDNTPMQLPPDTAHELPEEVKDLDLTDVPREELAVFNTIALIEMGDKAKDLKIAMAEARTKIEGRNVVADFVRLMSVFFFGR